MNASRCNDSTIHDSTHPPSVFGAFARRAHLHELRIELAEDFDQIGLRGHAGVDVLIDTRHFIEAGRRWARAQGYLLREVETEADRIGTAKDMGGEIGVLSATQLAVLLRGGRDMTGENRIPTREAELFISLGAFSGIRTAELLRLEWRDIHDVRGVIEVGAHKSKTATRRLVPIHHVLAQWLARAPHHTGKVFSSQKAAVRVISYGKQMLGEWPDNALRHSYATYRLGETQDAPKVALELGNSPAVLFRNYRDLADINQARDWFSITPAEPANVIAMKKGVAA